MKCLVLASLMSTALAGSIIAGDAAMSCMTKDYGMRALLQAKVGGTDCEDMCKRLGAYPNCQCPRFAGEPASDGDMRSCYDQNCQDPASPCPNDHFVGCVKENTAAFLMQMKATNFAVPCEDMCKRLGAYPNCQCPGFAGEPASDGDERSCYDQNCQDPASPCPNDHFVGCVKENTAKFLQWQAVMNRVSNGFDSMLQVARLAKATKG